MLYIFWGEDDFSLEEKLLEIKNSLGDASLLSTNTTILEGQRLSVNELKAIGGALPFLSPKRLLIVRGLLRRFEPPDRQTRSKSTKADTNKQQESKLLADCISTFPDSTVTILIDHIEIKNNALKDNPLFAALVDKASVASFPALKSVKLSQWIQTRVGRQGGSISRQATDLLLQTIGGDLHTLANEINKLTAFTLGRMIEEKDVKLVVSAAQELDIFALVEAIMDKKSDRAEKILENLLQHGTAPPQVLVLLARQVQIMVQAKELKGMKRPSSEIQNRLRIYNPVAFTKISGRADKYTLERLKEIYSSLLATDLAIKTGKLNGDLALNILVAELAES